MAKKIKSKKIASQKATTNKAVTSNAATKKKAATREVAKTKKVALKKGLPPKAKPKAPADGSGIVKHADDSAIAAIKTSSSNAATTDRKIFINGINGATGEYLVAPKTLTELTALARRTTRAPLERVAVHRRTRSFALPFGTDENNLAQTGWAVVYAPKTPPAVRKALEPLLEKRRKDAGKLYKELEYRQGESRDQFLQRYGASSTSVEPDRVPSFLLLVGDPQAIPFDVEFSLNIEYAVGRLTFGKAADYKLYADAVVSYEKAKKLETGRDIVYWGTEHFADEATELSAQFLIRPLNNGTPASGTISARMAMAQHCSFRSKCFCGIEATKAQLLSVLKSKKRPSVLFTASHGIGFPVGDPRQSSDQGALLCQDWPGFGSIKPAHYFTAKDVPNGTNLGGMIAFLFACYGAGTPQYDPFLKELDGGPVEVAKTPFVSALAQRLLTCGALAVVGHVERAWAYSIQPSAVGPQLQPFNNFLGRVLTGVRAGNAPVDFSDRYASESARLLQLLDPSRPEAKLPTDPDLTEAWIKRNDAQSYVLLGDPAVRLRSDDLT